MSSLNPPEFSGRHIVVAGENPSIVELVVRALRDDGHAVFHAYDVLSAMQLAIALESCDMVISDTKVEGADGVELIPYLRKQKPDLPIIYLASIGRSSGEVEVQLPSDVSILREPFTTGDLRRAVNAMLRDRP